MELASVRDRLRVPGCHPSMVVNYWPLYINYVSHPTLAIVEGFAIKFTVLINFSNDRLTIDDDDGDGDDDDDGDSFNKQ